MIQMCRTDQAQRNMRIIIRLSVNFVYDVLELISIHDVVAGNQQVGIIGEISIKQSDIRGLL